MWNQLSYLGPLHNDFYDLLYIYAAPRTRLQAVGRGTGQWTVEGLYKHNIAI